MDDSPFRRLREDGASVWLRHPTRRLLRSDWLGRLISEGAVGGIESDLRLTRSALSHAADASELLAVLSGVGSPQEAIEALLAAEGRLAAERLSPVFDQTGGFDGYVSIDVPTPLTDDAEAMTGAVHRLVGAIDRPNVMVKIPPTESGHAVVEAMTSEGYHVHVSPIFSLASYRRATEAYVEGLQRFLVAGGNREPVAAAASLQLAPLDIAVDERLRDQVRASGGDTSRLESLSGSAAIAIAKLVHSVRVELLDAMAEDLPHRWPQRLVWSHAVRKDPRFSTRRYLDNLIGPGTAASLPLANFLAQRSEIAASEALERDVDEAREILDDLEDAGIEMTALVAELEREAVWRKASDCDALLDRVGELADRGQPERRDDGVTERRYGRAPEPDSVERIWEKDPSLWATHETDHELIRNRLGWLDLVEPMLDEHRSAIRFAEEIEASDVERTLLLGTGGSVLCADVCRRIFGAERLIVLDSTVPAAVSAVAGRVDPARTLVLVSSKSGVTIEARALADFFFARATPILENPGDRFVALTDPGTPLEQLAHDRGFRRLWLTPPDVGGRFSALSFFGIVPMALMDLDTAAVLRSAQEMVLRCSPGGQSLQTPGARLGIALVEAFESGRDKLTVLTSDRTAPFGDWIEQLVAESTGKTGKGIVPVVSEPIGAADRYGPDRFFASVRLADEPAAALEELSEELEAAGHPVFPIVLDELEDLGGEFFRWELAVAIAAAEMGVNPFDEPDVRESKDRADAILDRLARGEPLDEPPPLAMGRPWALFADLDRDSALGSRLLGDSLADWLTAHLGRAEPPDYVCIQAFLEPRPGIATALQEARAHMRDNLGVATTLGWGPRFLHSTGQLHKGGPESGLFLQITEENADDIDCPGYGYSFGELARAQALGDFDALLSRGRRVVRLHLSNPDTGVAALLAAVKEAFD